MCRDAAERAPIPLPTPSFDMISAANARQSMMWMCNSLGLEWTLKYRCFHNFETAVLLEANRSMCDAPLLATACIMQVLGKYIELLSDILALTPPVCEHASLVWNPSLDFAVASLRHRGRSNFKS